jgi:hypothetical protein
MPANFNLQSWIMANKKPPNNIRGFHFTLTDQDSNLDRQLQKL